MVMNTFPASLLRPAPMLRFSANCSYLSPTAPSPTLSFWIAPIIFANFVLLHFRPRIFEYKERCYWSKHSAYVSFVGKQMFKRAWKKLALHQLLTVPDIHLAPAGLHDCSTLFPLPAKQAIFQGLHQISYPHHSFFDPDTFLKAKIDHRWEQLIFALLYILLLFLVTEHHDIFPMLL